MIEHKHEHHHHHGEDCGCGHEHEHHHHHGEDCGCGHEHEHHHHHDEGCGCGHEHEHHHHDEECGCDHEHEHHHHHDEGCGCGHEHEHHHHGEDCGCDHEHEHNHHHEEETLPGVIYTNVRLQDDAKVVSGRLLISGSYDDIKDKLKEGLEEFAAAVNEKGGVVGHIKASVEVTTVDMFSVTETAAMVKRAPEQNMRIILAAIVFFIEPEEAETLAKSVLEKII